MSGGTWVIALSGDIIRSAITTNATVTVASRWTPEIASFEAAQMITMIMTAPKISLTGEVISANRCVRTIPLRYRSACAPKRRDSSSSAPKARISFTAAMRSVIVAVSSPRS